MSNFKLEDTVGKVFVCTFKLKKSLLPLVTPIAVIWPQVALKCYFLLKIPLGMSNHAIFARKMFLKKMLGMTLCV